MRNLFAAAIATSVISISIPAIAQISTSSPTSPFVKFVSPIQTIDEAAIATMVHSVANLADQGDFETLESLFASEIQVDYTSLFGGAIQTQTPEGLMTAWASVLPGFDQTYHAISNIQVDVKGDRAIATADVTASHYLGDDYWQVSGQYEYQLVRQPNHWKVETMTFKLSDEQGDRALLEQATAAAADTPSSYLQQQQTEQAVRAFLTSLETKDMDAFAAVWAEDAVQDMPYAPEGFPRRVEGRDNLIQHYGAWPEVSGEANFTNELVFYPMEDPTMVFAEWHGMVEIIPTGRIYDQRYGGLFRVVDGKIVLFREYFNPIVFVEAFGLNEGGEFGNQ
ncbi:nuclear transport factor 2 family protein [Nodosilinea sp. LEGE 07088]|uniref:nuclear transport factor 2 family protein n=1 Tax=Nodosilinea sp. LEGE 07088 TaxID=2777968 RepID=UPI00187E9F08|nr:nuclear transport factor 2 family protein [Nodosilinea sp. LEGE 07088]MBE9137438.1 nuclear transport factor 2 family protein [Nodosilinea sp. LEGE 07088]